MTFVLTGLDIEAKAELGRAHAVVADPGRPRRVRDGRRPPAPHRPTRTRRPTRTPSALLRITVMDPDRAKVGRAFSNTIIEMVLASVPGFFTTTPPGDATSFGVYWPTLVPSTSQPTRSCSRASTSRSPRSAASPTPRRSSRCGGAASRTVGIRTGDWTACGPATDRGPPSGAPRPGLRRSLGRQGRQRQRRGLGPRRCGPRLAHEHLTVDLLRELMPDVADLEIRAYDLPNLRARNFVIVGLLGDGVRGVSG